MNMQNFEVWFGSKQAVESKNCEQFTSKDPY